MRHTESHYYEPSVHHDDAPALQIAPLVFDREGVRSIDQLAASEFGIPGIVLMENAARGLLPAALHLHRRSSMLSSSTALERRIIIVCGAGNNGGDGYALARHLHNRGLDVMLARVGEPSATSDAGINRKICQRMGICEQPIDHVMRSVSTDRIALIVDALFGTGLDRPVIGIAAEAIQWMNAARCPILAADVPSGMDCDTGEILGCAVHATRTVTFVGLKAGFVGLDAQSLLGEVIVADIGVPRSLLERFGQRIDLPHPEPPEHESLNLQPSHAGN
jgi:NAD(P)H-hydrate epimerase